MQIYLSPAVCLIGLAVFLISERAKVPEVGKIMFFCGLLASLLQFAGKSFGIH